MLWILWNELKKTTPPGVLVLCRVEDAMTSGSIVEQRRYFLRCAGRGEGRLWLSGSALEWSRRWSGTDRRTGRRFAVFHITLGLFHCDIFLIFTTVIIVESIVPCIVVIGVVATIVAIVFLVIVAIVACRIGSKRSIIIIIIILCAVDDGDAIITDGRVDGSGFSRDKGIHCKAEL